MIFLLQLDGRRRKYHALLQQNLYNTPNTTTERKQKSPQLKKKGGFDSREKKKLELFIESTSIIDGEEFFLFSGNFSKSIKI